MSKIGPDFVNELAAAGLTGLPFTWGPDGDFQFDPSMTQAQQNAVMAVFAAHDPSKGQYIAAALARLAQNDDVATRCVKAGVPYPAEWLAFDQALRDIVSGNSAGPLPTTPAFPAGT